MCRGLTASRRWGIRESHVNDVMITCAGLNHHVDRNPKRLEMSGCSTMRGLLSTWLCVRCTGVLYFVAFQVRPRRGQRSAERSFGLGFFLRGWAGRWSRVNRGGADGCNFVDGCVQLRLFSRGGLEPADLPDELQISVANFRVGYLGICSLEEVFNPTFSSCTRGNVRGGVGRPERDPFSGTREKESKNGNNSRSSACGEDLD